MIHLTPESRVTVHRVSTSTTFCYYFRYLATCLLNAHELKISQNGALVPAHGSCNSLSLLITATERFWSTAPVDLIAVQSTWNRWSARNISRGSIQFYILNRIGSKSLFVNHGMVHLVKRAAGKSGASSACHTIKTFRIKFASTYVHSTVFYP